MPRCTDHTRMVLWQQVGRKTRRVERLFRLSRTGLSYYGRANARHGLSFATLQLVCVEGLKGCVAAWFEFQISRARVPPKKIGKSQIRVCVIGALPQLKYLVALQSEHVQLSEQGTGTNE